MPRTLAVLLTAALTAATAAAQDPCQAPYQAFDQLYQQRYELDDHARLAALAHHARGCYETTGTQPQRAAALLEAETFALIKANDHRAALDRLAVFFDRYAGAADAYARVQHRLHQGNLAHRVGDLHAMDQALQGALEEARALADTSRHKVHLAVAGAFQGAGVFQSAAEVLRRLLQELSETTRTERLLKAQALELLAYGALQRCPPPRGQCSFEAAAQQAQQAAALFDEAGRTQQAGQARATWATLLSWMGRPVEAAELLEAVVSAAEARSQTRLALEAATELQRIEETFGLGVSPSSPVPVVPALVLGALALLLLVHVAQRRRRRRKPKKPWHKGQMITVEDYFDPEIQVHVPDSAVPEAAPWPLNALHKNKRTLVGHIFFERPDPDPPRRRDESD